MAVIAEPHRGHAAGIHNPSHSRISRRLQNVAGAIDVRLVKLLAVNGPQSVVGRHVEHQFATGHPSLQRLEIAKITNDAVRRQAVNIVRSADRPHQETQISASSLQFPRDVASQKSRRSCYETFHDGDSTRERKAYDLGRNLAFSSSDDWHE